MTEDGPQNFDASALDICLVGVNARFAHTSLGVRCLHAYLKQHGRPAWRCEVQEWTASDPAARIVRSLFLAQARLYAFSCSIWNISLIEQVSRQLKGVAPRVFILWGGPEVSQDAARRMRANRAVDFIICGEGEEPFLALCRNLFRSAACLDDDLGQVPGQDTGLSQIPGLVWRDSASGKIRANPPAPPLEGSAWAFPYASGQIAELSERILYYESSRGCPFRCSYCLSALDKSARFRPLELVFQEIEQFVAAGARQVRWVDRTFNCNPARARAIWGFIAESFAAHPDSPTQFNFEIAADLLDGSAIDCLNQMPAGRVKLEIGIQTIHDRTLRAIGRPFRAEQAREAIARLRQAGRVHLHLDLIAGLPGETLADIAASFDWVFRLQPQQLQLGFLKVLPGSLIRRQACRFRIVSTPEPPYEVLRTATLSYPDLLRLKAVAAAFEQHWNNGLFVRSIIWIVARWPSPFAFFDAWAAWPEMGVSLERGAPPPADRARLLWRFGLEADPEMAGDGAAWLAEAWLGLIRLDYLTAGHKDQPGFLACWESSRRAEDRARISELRGLFRSRYPQCRRLFFERFPFDWACLETEGRLVPGQSLASFDHSGAQAVLLDIASGDALY